MLNILLVGIGGFIGSVLRYLVAVKVELLFVDVFFPFGTMVVNITGCFVIGLISGFSEYVTPISPRIKFFLITGILGGYTTFSSFGNDTFILLREKEILFVALNTGVQLVVGVIAVWLGYLLSKVISTYLCIH